MTIRSAADDPRQNPPPAFLAQRSEQALDRHGQVPEAGALGPAAGDWRAWERLVDQYARLIWSITAEFRLMESDAADVAQTTWLRLLEHIDPIEYPDRVGSWLAATARNECLRSLAARKRLVLADDDEVLTDLVAYGPEVDERILVRLDRIARAVERGNSECFVISHSLSRFIRHQLIYAAALPTPDADAQALGEKRYRAFLDSVARMMANADNDNEPAQADKDT